MKMSSPNRIFRALALKIVLILSSFIGFSQGAIEKLELQQNFIYTMHAQTREHIIIDSLTHYYQQFDYDSLNQAQRDLVFIRQLCDSLYTHQYVDLMTTNLDLILVEADQVFNRIGYKPMIESIENFRQLKVQLDPLIQNGTLHDKLDWDSPSFDIAIEDDIETAIFILDDNTCMLPRGKVLSFYQYIIDNQSSLYK